MMALKMMAFNINKMYTLYSFEFIQVNLLYLYLILKCTKFVESWKTKLWYTKGLGSDICVHNGDNETKADCKKGQSFMCRAIQKIRVHMRQIMQFFPLFWKTCISSYIIFLLDSLTIILFKCDTTKFHYGEKVYSILH